MSTIQALFEGCPRLGFYRGESFSIQGKLGLLLEGIVAVDAIDPSDEKSITTCFVEHGQLLNPTILSSPTSWDRFLYFVESEKAIIATVELGQVFDTLQKWPPQKVASFYKALSKAEAYALLDTISTATILATCRGRNKLDWLMSQYREYGLDLLRPISRDRLASALAMEKTRVSKLLTANGLRAVSRPLPKDRRQAVIV